MRIVRDPKTGPSKCRSCGARIVWAVTDNGKRMPVDAQSSLDVQGTRLILWTDSEAPTVQRVSSRGAFEVARGELYAGPTWGAHWGTCPSAAEHRSYQADRLEGPREAVHRQLSLSILKGGRQ
jgi:hypothetical protein